MYSHTCFMFYIIYFLIISIVRFGMTLFDIASFSFLIKNIKFEILIKKTHKIKLKFLK